MLKNYNCQISYIPQCQNETNREYYHCLATQRMAPNIVLFQPVQELYASEWKGGYLRKYSMGPSQSKYCTDVVKCWNTS